MKQNQNMISLYQCTSVFTKVRPKIGRAPLHLTAFKGKPKFVAGIFV